MTMPAALRGNMIGGSVYEYGPHIFHTTDPEILAEIKVTMGPDLLPYKHTIRKFLGNYFQFPLSMREALLLPATTVLWAVVRLFTASSKGPAAGRETSRRSCAAITAMFSIRYF